MRHRYLFHLAFLFAATSCLGPAVAAQSVHGIPLKPDPPFEIDGDLGDWASVPSAIALNRKEQAVYGPGAWESPADLSGTACLAWRNEHLYLAVDVTDDTISQPQRGTGLWMGDHIELYLDVEPTSEPQRTSLREGQFQLAFSPGNFLATGDPLLDSEPETYAYLPDQGPIPGAVVAAKRTNGGYTIEAAVPWKAIGKDTVAIGTPLNFEIGISDTDTVEPQQETMMTVSTAPWVRTRSRLMVGALAGSDGVAPPIAGKVQVFDRLAIQRGENETVCFVAPPAPEKHMAVLLLKARLEYPKVAGYTPALRLTLNGKSITADRLMNKPLKAQSFGGEMYSMAAGDRFSTYYSPDFTSAHLHPHYGLIGGVKACHFEFDVTELIREGTNELEIQHAAPVDPVLHVGDAQLVFQIPPAPEKKAGPPTGPLNRIEPRREFVTDYSVEQIPSARIEVTVNGETFMVESFFSTPEGEWTNTSCSYFEHKRRIEKRNEALMVYDTFENLTANNLPLMIRYQAVLGDRTKEVWLGGLRKASGEGISNDPSNPTSFAATQHAGIGLLPLSDVFHIHVTNYALGGELGIADYNLVLPPGGTYAAEWAIVPCDTGEYWRFINSVRRLVDANFRIDGGFCFLRHGPPTDEWTDQRITDFLRYKDVLYRCTSILYPLYQGRYTHGTSFQRVSHDAYRAAGERQRRLVPGVQHLVYFHCFLDVTDDAPERFADARTLRPDGSHADYGRPMLNLFFPTEKNTFGREIEKNVDIIFDEIGADGVYWDEHEYSRRMYHFGEPWDGFSGDIDRQTMQLIRLKSSIVLLTESWRVGLAKRILARGSLIGNSVPLTRKMAELHFPCFVETGAITNCAKSHLYSPIALGDHLTERSELDACRCMLEALNYGCVYHWYHDLYVVPTHHHLTRYMYPITPIELHEGYIIGKERIVTNRSGLFGWGDASEHEVHVFDETGREVSDFETPRVEVDGKTYTELRVAEDWSAAIVRKRLESAAPPQVERGNLTPLTPPSPPETGGEGVGPNPVHP
jgi:hypothetical protein